MILRFKNIFYLSIIALVFFLIINNWNFLTETYNYNIYKENCIITKINDQKNYPNNISEDLAEKYCDCKIENFKNENIEIFVSKLRVKKKFIAKEKIIDKECRKNLKVQNSIN